MRRRQLEVVGVALLAAGLLLEGYTAAKPPSRSARSSGKVVNLNTATPKQLRLLPGIGATKAERIVRYRNKHKFRSVHELVRVRGIGRRTMHKLKPYLTITGPTTLTEKAKPSGDG